MKLKIFLIGLCILLVYACGSDDRFPSRSQLEGIINKQLKKTPATFELDIEKCIFPKNADMYRYNNDYFKVKKYTPKWTMNHWLAGLSVHDLRKAKALIIEPQKDLKKFILTSIPMTGFPSCKVVNINIGEHKLKEITLSTEKAFHPDFGEVVSKVQYTTIPKNLNKVGKAILRPEEKEFEYKFEIYVRPTERGWKLVEEKGVKVLEYQ